MTPSNPPGPKGENPAAPRTKSALLAGFRRKDVEFFAVALLAGTVTSLYPVTRPSSPSRVNRVIVRVWVGASLNRAVKSVGASQRLRETVSLFLAQEKDHSLLLEFIEPFR